MRFYRFASSAGVASRQGSAAGAELAAAGAERQPDVRAPGARRRALLRGGLSMVALVMLAFVNLSDYPKMWFDEGIHLHVPKAVVNYGVYADCSSDGFRYYGPTLSVGPTVMLPVAFALWIGGVGVWQARAVMALYLVLAIVAFFALARRVENPRFAWVATALLLASPGVDIVWLGRQLLGEVPGLLFLVLGLIVWLDGWPAASLRRLALAGLLFGLAVVTKYQFLILLGPGLVLACAADRLYYRQLAPVSFLVPLAITVVCFAAWQAIGIVYLGPSVASENLKLMAAATAGAAASFSADQMRRAAEYLLDFRLYASLLLPALAYTLFRAVARDRRSQMWTTLLCFVLPGFCWFVTMSIGWPRYAFAAAAVGALMVARLLGDLTGGFRWRGLRGAGRPNSAVPAALGLTAWLWLVLAVAPGIAMSAHRVLFPPPNHAQAMAMYLDRHVPRTALVETWEPEMGFLTDHRYHYPPPALLIDAVAFIWTGGPPLAARYDFLDDAHPDYVLEGEFARWVKLYPDAVLEQGYRLETEIGAYRLYGRRSSHDRTRAEEVIQVPR